MAAGVELPDKGVQARLLMFLHQRRGANEIAGVNRIPDRLMLGERFHHASRHYRKTMMYRR